MIDTSKYDDLSEAELATMTAAREREYATTTLVDQEAGLDTPEEGLDVMAAAAVQLKVRGILLADATQEQLADALVAVSR